jgi:hypothetical protein
MRIPVLVVQVPLGKAKDEPDGEHVVYVIEVGDTVMERTPILIVAVVPPLVLASAGAQPSAPSAQTDAMQSANRMLPLRGDNRLPRPADEGLASRTMMTRNGSFDRTALSFRSCTDFKSATDAWNDDRLDRRRLCRLPPEGFLFRV